MKKKHRCFFKRFAALVAALVLCASLCVPAFASNVVADIPSVAEFRKHPSSWFVWRSFDLNGYTYYELTASSISFDGDFVSSGPTYENQLFDISYTSGSDSHYDFACATPIPITGVSPWSALPSFTITSGFRYYSSAVRFYPASGTDLSNLYIYLVPLFNQSDLSVGFSASSGSLNYTVPSGFFDSPFYSYSFALRSYSSTLTSGYHLVGGSSKFSTASSSSGSVSNNLSLSGSYYINHYDSLAPYPQGYNVSTSNLGVVFVRKPSSGLITSASFFSASVSGVFTVLVNSVVTGDLTVGSWLSTEDLKDLQDQLVNDFDVDSDTLKNSKDNLNSWNSTSSVDSDIASGAIGFLNGIFQNLGTFLFSVSLLCFGAVVLRMLIRKAVDG